MAKRFSKEELFTGPPIFKRKFMVTVVLQNMIDEAFLVHEEIEADYYDIIDKRGLELYDLDDIGEPIYRASFREWAYIREIRANESAEKK